MRALSKHPDWPARVDKLDEALALHGTGARAGRREGQAHLTLSRRGLVRSFNHYLKHGAEVDQHLAHYLLGTDGEALLEQDGDPTLIRFLVPLNEALAACNRYAFGSSVYPAPYVISQ